MARPEVRQQKSYPILGAGICLTGIVVLCIGLIIGFEFPKYILRQGQLRVCITSPSSRGFEPWVYNRNRTKRNYLYVWNMTDEGQDGRKAQWNLVGPYVYDEREVKVDIGFRYGQVTYRSWTTQSFNEELTRSHCANCAEDDKVITVNPAFLQLVNVFPNELAYFLSMVPSLLSSGTNGTSTVAAKSVDFDEWLAMRDDHDHDDDSQLDSSKRAVLGDSRRRTRRTLAADIGIYELLSDVHLFAPSVLRRPKSQRICDELLDLVSSPTSFVNDDDDALSRHCGLAYLLLKLRNSTEATEWTRLVTALSVLTCRNSGRLCFLQDDGSSLSPSPSPSPSANLTKSYVRVLVAYITEYLPSVLRKRTNFTHDVTDELSVRRFAVGYRSIDDMSIRGVLEHRTSEDVDGALARRHTLRTCLFNRSQIENLRYDEIDDFRCVDGIQDYEIPPTRSLTPCRQAEPFSSEIRFYLPELWRSVTYTDYGSAVHDGGVRLNEFRPTEDVVNLTSTKDFTGYLSWVKMTGDFFANDPETSAAAASESNRIFVEPISGYVWRRTANVQFFVGIKWDFTSPRHGLDRPILSHTLRVQIEPSRESLRFHDSDVNGLMRASCVGLIGLSIVGVLVVALGICVAMALIRTPSNRVAPQLYFNPHLPPMETEDEGFGGNTVILY